MTLSRRRSVLATAGLIAASWLLSSCSNQAAPETKPLGTGGAEPAAIGLETSNQSVTVTNNAGKPIEDVLIAIQPVSVGSPFTLTVRRMENGEKRDIALGQFRSNDGTTFSPRLYKARHVTVTATDILGKKHEIRKPWRP
jgi:hypothetical protein